MDELNLILQALTVGANAAVQQTAGKAILDVYGALKALIQRKFSDQPKAQTTLMDYEYDPDTYEKPLSKFLSINHIDKDVEIIAVARRLMTLVHEENIIHNQIINQGPVENQIGVNYGYIRMDNRRSEEKQ